jgi:hypothetical protein
MTVTCFGVVQTRMLEARARDIVDDMLTSIRLVRQLDDYVEEKHVLVDDHTTSIAWWRSTIRAPPPACRVFRRRGSG